MSKLNNEVIENKIKELIQLETIKEQDLLVDNESIVDHVLLMPISDQKIDFLNDFLMLDIDKIRKDEFFVNKILETNDPNLVNTFISKNKDDKQFQFDVLKSTLENNVSCKTFSLVNSLMKSAIFEFSDKLLEEAMQKPINEDMNNKVFTLILGNSRSDNKLSEDIVVSNLAKNANPKLLKTLLSSKLDFNCVNVNNENAFFYLNGKDEKEIKAKFDLLVESGVDSQVKNLNGLTALDFNKNLKVLVQQSPKDEVKKTKRRSVSF